MNEAVWFYLLFCLSGPTCPEKSIASSQAYFDEGKCEAEARLIAQHMFITSGNKYGFRCEKTDYEPPKVKGDGK